MLIPLDFIWINDNKIVAINKNVQPSDYQPPKSIIPEFPINKVLEINAGFVERNNINLGNIIEED